VIRESDKIVARYIDDGTYFKEAFNWYASKYLFPVTLRSYFIIGFIALALGFSTIFYESLIKITTDKYPFPIYALDQTKYFPFIKSLAKEKEPLERSFARYFVRTYILYREKYEYLNFIGENKEILLNKIKAFSSRRVYREYLDYIDPEQNPDSPVVLYKNRTTRNIEIMEILFLKHNHAKINFKAIEDGPLEIKESNWTSEITFQLDDIEEAFKRKDKVNFIVTTYKTYPTY
jgi:type IV secretion system protein VirB8